MLIDRSSPTYLNIAQYHGIATGIKAEEPVESSGIDYLYSGLCDKVGDSKKADQLDADSTKQISCTFLEITGDGSGRCFTLSCTYPGTVSWIYQVCLTLPCNRFAAIVTMNSAAGVSFG